MAVVVLSPDPGAASWEPQGPAVCAQCVSSSDSPMLSCPYQVRLHNVGLSKLATEGDRMTGQHFTPESVYEE